MPKYLCKVAMPVAFRRSVVPSQWILVTALCGSWIFVSCGGGSTSSTPTPAPSAPTLQSVTVSPQSGTVAAGLTQQFSATGNYSDGSSRPINNVTWATSNTALATISSTGLVTALKQGSVTVSATSGTTTGSTLLTVGPPQLVSISLSPRNPAISDGQTQQFTATGSYTDGSTQNLNGVTWSSGTTAVATIGNNGFATALSAGSTMIEAMSGGVSGATTLTVTAAVSQTFTYVLSATIPTGGTQPEGMVVADFNGDGKPDIAVTNKGTDTVAVFLNEGSGTFGTPIITTVQISDQLGALAVGDFNEDGKADLVVATISGSQASIVLLGNGDGTFRQQPPIPNSFGFFHAKVVDLNGDGHQDLVFAENGNISVALGKGDGTFAATTQLASGSSPGTYLGLCVADFNGDGKLDILGLDTGSSAPPVVGGYLDFYAGKGDGTFAAPTVTNSVGTSPFSLGCGDFNGDGKQDVLIGLPAEAFIAYGKGDGTFDLINIQVLSQTFGMTVLAAQLTKDGKWDAVVADTGVAGVTLQISLNSALGQAPPNPGIFSLTLPPDVTEMAAGDLNGDGILDIVALSYQSNEISIVLSRVQ